MGNEKADWKEPWLSLLQIKKAGGGGGQGLSTATSPPTPGRREKLKVTNRAFPYKFGERKSKTILQRRGDLTHFQHIVSTWRPEHLNSPCLDGSSREGGGDVGTWFELD